MRCISCGHEESKVVDSRSTDDNSSIRRRRECEKCGFRFTTYEKIDKLSLVVIKKSGRREPFDKQKMIEGLLHSCKKRPISIKTLEKAVDQIEEELQNNKVREITTTKIGDLVLEKLHAIDKIAYIRFASVYKEFDDVDTFVNEIIKVANE